MLISIEVSWRGRKFHSLKFYNTFTLSLSPASNIQFNSWYEDEDDDKDETHKVQQVQWSSKQFGSTLDWPVALDWRQM